MALSELLGTDGIWDWGELEGPYRQLQFRLNSAMALDSPFPHCTTTSDMPAGDSKIWIITSEQAQWCLFSL